MVKMEKTEQRMIVSLQKRHRQIWTIFAIVLPILFIISYFAIRDLNTTSDGILKSNSNYSNYNYSHSNVHFGYDSTTIEVALQNDLRQSACLVFIASDNSIKNEEPIGQLFKKGIYTFKLSNPIEKNDKILLYNPISKTIFETIEIQ